LTKPKDKIPNEASKYAKGGPKSSFLTILKERCFGSIRLELKRHAGQIQCGAAESFQPQGKTKFVFLCTSHLWHTVFFIDPGGQPLLIDWRTEFYLALFLLCLYLSIIRLM
jgi:hypothetical protein